MGIIEIGARRCESWGNGDWHKTGDKAGIAEMEDGIVQGEGDQRVSTRAVRFIARTEGEWR